MRDQIELTFKIGVSHEQFTTESYDLFEKEIVRAACIISGGCSMTYETGFWTEDGALKNVNHFVGEPEQEVSVTIMVTCELFKAQQAYEEIKDAIVQAAYEHQIDTNWVHVLRQPVTGMHFSVRDALAPTAPVTEEIVEAA